MVSVWILVVTAVVVTAGPFVVYLVCLRASGLRFSSTSDTDCPGDPPETEDTVRELKEELLLASQAAEGLEKRNATLQKRLDEAKRLAHLQSQNPGFILGSWDPTPRMVAGLSSDIRVGLAARYARLIRVLGAKESGGHVCLFCQEGGCDVVVLPCRHAVICGKCVRAEAWENNDKKVCPQCAGGVDDTVEINRANE